MNGLIYFVTIIVVILIYRTVSAAIKENKDNKTMKTANNQTPTPKSVPSALDAAGVPVPEPTDNESTRNSYDILLAALADQGCRILTDEPCEETGKNSHILDFMYQGGYFISMVSKETQFLLLRFAIPIDTEVKDFLHLLGLANNINTIETLYKTIVYKNEDRYIVELDYCCMSVTSQDIITALDDMLRIYLTIQNSLYEIEPKENQ